MPLFVKKGVVWFCFLVGIREKEGKIGKECYFLVYCMHLKLRIKWLHVSHVYIQWLFGNFDFPLNRI